jgi:uncharacterized protein (DUF1015 family)
VTEVRPFRASIVRPEWAARVVSPMHDSLTPEERADIKTANPDSFLHVTRRAGDPGESDDPRVAASEGTAALDHLLAKGAFRELSEPSLFVYRIEVDGSPHTGLVADVPVEAFKSGDVRGHEDVEPERVDALSLYLEGVGTSSDPVALMFRPNHEVRRLFAEIEREEPLLRIGRDDGTLQRVWRVEDRAALETITARLASEVMYVADGHHRVAASIAASERMEDPSRAAVLCVLYPADELRVLAFHRRVVGPLDTRDFLARLEERFLVEDTDESRPVQGSFGIRIDRHWVRASPKGTGRPPGVAGLDVTRLHQELLQPVLGIADVGDPRLEVVPDTVPVEELAARADEDGGALFTLAAPAIDEVLEVADRGEIVPPKSTYFLPKPMSGVFLRVVG